MPRVSRRLPPVPPECPEELMEKIGADILAKVERCWPRRKHELGLCLVWREARRQSRWQGVYMGGSTTWG